jgi:hypothetical protein
VIGIGAKPNLYVRFCFIFYSMEFTGINVYAVWFGEIFHP